MIMHERINSDYLNIILLLLFCYYFRSFVRKLLQSHCEAYRWVEVQWIQEKSLRVHIVLPCHVQRTSCAINLVSSRVKRFVRVVEIQA